MKPLQERVRALGLRAIDLQWERYGDATWLEDLVAAEEVERARLGVEPRTKRSRLGRFKPMADFDWSSPRKLDRRVVESLFKLAFLDEGVNLVFVGPNGVGKTMMAKNLAHSAIVTGRTVRFTTASAMLHDLVSQDGGSALQRALRRYSSPNLLVIDEVGDLSYDHRHADLLYVPAGPHAAPSTPERARARTPASVRGHRSRARQRPAPLLAHLRLATPADHRGGSVVLGRTQPQVDQASKRRSPREGSLGGFRASTGAEAT